jgi:hypothetical protein
MKEQNDPTSRPNGLLSVALRLGCALLACAGIAAARSALGPADETAALRHALEQRVGAVLDAARETGAALGSSAGASVRQARRAKSAPRRASPAASASARAPFPPVFTASGAFAPTDFTLVSTSSSSSPRGPPASA